MSNDVMDFLGESDYEKYPTVTWPKVGAFVEGRLVRAPRKVTTTNQNTREPEVKVLFDLELVQPCWGKRPKTPDNLYPENEELPAGTIVTLWIKKGQQAAAMKRAATNAGATSFAEGGLVFLKFTGKRPVEGKPQPMHLFEESRYTPPVPSMPLGDFDDE